MRRLTTSLALIALAAVPAVALAHDDAKPKTHTVRVGDDFFNPTTKKIHVKDVVKWVWVGEDGEPGATVNEHTITEAKDRFSSATKTEGTFKYRFKKAGKFTVYCADHPLTMKLTVTVKK